MLPMLNPILKGKGPTPHQVHPRHSKKGMALRLLVGLFLGLDLLFSPLAFGHHPLAGNPPSTLLEGLFSGFAHPVIEIDHFAFVLAVGLLAAVYASRILLPVFFIGGTILGTGFSVLGVGLPWGEVWVALSLVGVGIVLALGRGYPLLVCIGLGALAGVFHGMAYGEAVIGAQTGPIASYLLGLGSVQMLLVFGTATVTTRILRLASPIALFPRVAGIAVTGAGLVLLVDPMRALIG